MIRLSDIDVGNPLVPSSEAILHSQMSTNEARYNGKAGLVEPDTETPTGIPVNWYKRIALSFAEFVYGERPVIRVEGNDELTDYIRAHVTPSLYRALFYANVDMVRFGTGVVVEPYGDPLSFMCCKASDWYPLYDDVGERILGDVIIRYVKRVWNQPGQAVVDIFNREAGYQQRRIYRSNGGNFDRLDFDGDQIPMGMYRRAQVITNGYPEDGYGESLYDDIAPFVLELGKKLGELGTNITENAKPDLYGPEDALELDSDGDYVLGGTRPRYLPVPSGGVPPDYLTWDSNAEAIQYFREQCEELIFNFTGLTRSIYDPNTLAGNVTGNALRRLLLPFVSRINLITEFNVVAITQALRAHEDARIDAGMPPFEWKDEDIVVEWGFDDLLGDDEGKAESRGDDA